MPIVKLTQQFIANDLKCPEGKNRIEYCCDFTQGLYALVSATSPGVGTFFLRFRDSNGKTCHQKIGRTTDISLADARKEAKRLRNPPKLDRESI